MTKAYTEYKVTDSVFALYNSELFGSITLESDGVSLTGLWLEGQRKEPLPALISPAESFPVFEETARWLDIYLSGREPDFMPPVKLNGTPFRLTVWELLREIPYGHTVTYGALAAAVARKTGVQAMSAQAVGGAVGHNPVSVIIPCHRVIGAHGSLTGYAGGVDKKVKLLELEGVKI